MQATQRRTPETILDLSIGHPGPDLLPLELFRQAAELRLETDNSLLQYGLEQGEPAFRESLANFLTAAYHSPTSAEQLFITCGASQALDLICTRFSKPGDCIFVEEPSYFLALNIFADHGLNPVAIPLQDDGVNLELFEAALKHHRPKFFYTVPSFQNPSGISLSNSKRKKLVELSQAHHFLLVADEVYHLLRYDGSAAVPLAHYPGSEQVLSLGSFSKILAPGARLGWVQAAPSHIKKLSESGLLFSGGGLNPFTSALVGVILRKGWQAQQLEHVKAIYTLRRDALAKALSDYVPDLNFTLPAGGYFIWLKLPSALRASTLAEKALENGLAFQAGSKFSSLNALDNFLRLSFAHYEPDDLREAVIRLKRIIASAKE